MVSCGPSHVSGFASDLYEARYLNGDRVIDLSLNGHDGRVR